VDVLRLVLHEQLHRLHPGGRDDQHPEQHPDRLHAPLQTPTVAQKAIVTKYDAPPYTSSSNTGAIPFIDFGGQYIQVGDLSMLGPTNLTGNWAKIAADLKTPVDREREGRRRRRELHDRRDLQADEQSARYRLYLSRQGLGVPALVERQR